MPAMSVQSNASPHAAPAGGARSHRGRKLPPVQKAEAERLVAEFLARHRVTACPTRYAVAIEQLPQFSRGGH
jgi:hypothetical protein